MNDQQQTLDKPTQDTFDFSAYISGKSTFPKFEHTVYLDQDNGMALARAADEYTELARRVEQIIQELGEISENRRGSLVSEETEGLHEESEQARARLGELEARIEKLKKLVWESGVTLHFQVGTAQSTAEVVRQAEEEYEKENGREAKESTQYITWILASQMTAFCTKLTLPGGQEQKAPNRQGFLDLLNSLISAESGRLMGALNEALDSSVTWADQIDAGFPGGSADVAGEPVGSSGTEGGQGMVGAAFVDPHRGGSLMGG